MQIQIFLDGRVLPTSSTEMPDDPDELARGRNGWFRPRQITIWRGVRIVVAVRSRRQGDNAPLQLHLAPDAAHALGRALLAAAVDTDDVAVPPPEPAARVSVEVEWHPEYWGGDYDDTGELTVIEVTVGPGVYVTDASVAAAFTALTGHNPIHIIRWVEVAEPVG